MTFPIDRVRAEFPSLGLTDDGRERVYLDNPAGTQVPRRVADAVGRCLIEANANLGGHFATSTQAGAVVAGAHQAMADFLGAQSPSEIVIGANMTTLTFHLSRSICRDFKPGDEIVLTRMDHDGNIAPWLEIAADRDLVVRWLSFDPDTWRLEPAALERVLSERTRLVAINHASNLLGSINDVPALAAVAKAAGALVYVDSVQFAPHGLIDVAALGCDFLVCSSYKFFGPHLGILWGRRELLAGMHAYKVRCVGEELPHKYETGTPQIELLAGLTATVDYFRWLGEITAGGGGPRQSIAGAFAALTRHEQGLAQRLIAGLEAIPGIRVLGITDPDVADLRVPTVAFRHEHARPAAISSALGAAGIFVWDGHNYALEVVRQLGIPEEQGVVRIGLVHYNTAAEIDRTLEAVAAAVATPGNAPRPKRSPV